MRAAVHSSPWPMCPNCATRSQQEQEPAFKQILPFRHHSNINLHKSKHKKKQKKQKKVRKECAWTVFTTGEQVRKDFVSCARPEHNKNENKANPRTLRGSGSLHNARPSWLKMKVETLWSNKVRWITLRLFLQKSVAPIKLSICFKATI